jgi:dTDP-4-amino-4,6-dideoxygalactose transaminase
MNKPFKWPIITSKTRKAVSKQLDEAISIYDKSGIIEEFEGKFARYHGSKYALTMNSGTNALFSMFNAVGIGEGDEVICPVYTFFATVTPLFFLRAVPILVDCDPCGNIDPDKILRKISRKTKAIVITHMWGFPCQMDKILSIAKEKGIILLEDCSHAHGATYNGKKVGTFGEAAVFSIQGQKTLTGGEGGVLLTDHEEIYYRSLLLGHYNKRCHQEIPTEHPLSKYSTTGMGLKFRIHPLAAAIANEQLDNLDKILSGRRKFAHHIYEKLDGLKEIKLPKVPPFVQPSWYALTFSFIGNSSGLSDADFYRNVKERGAYEIDRPKSTCPLYWLPLFRTPSLCSTQLVRSHI